MYSYDRRLAARPISIDKGQAKKLAQKAARELPKYLKFRPDDMSGPLSQARGYRATWGFFVGTYQTTDVMGNPVNVEVEVRAKAPKTWRGPRYWVTGGSVRSHYQAGPKGKAVGYGSKIGFRLSINSERSPQDLIDHLSDVEKELYSVIIHEATHLRDLLTHTPAAEEPGAKEYYNKPSEVRAFMQQIVDEVLEYLHERGKDEGGWFFYGLDRDFVESALDKSDTWDRIRRELTPQNERLILKGVIRSIQDEWSTFKRLYPDDVI
jgi:hypothetical protein